MKRILEKALVGFFVAKAFLRILIARVSYLAWSMGPITAVASQSGTTPDCRV